MKRAMLLGALAVTTLVVALLMWQLREVVLLFMLALAIAAAARPLIDALVERGVKRGVALLGVYLVTISIGATTTYFLAIELGGELQKAGDQLLVGYERLRSSLLISHGMRERIGSLLPNIDALGTRMAASRNIAGNAALWTMSFVQLLGHIVLVLVLALYWDAYRQESLTFWLGLLRPERRRRVRELWVRTLANVGDQLRSEVGQSLMTLGACALIFRGFGMSYWLLPSVVVALTRLFPFVGVLFGTAAAGLAGWVDGPRWALLAAAVVPCVHFVLEHIIARRLLHRQPSNPVVLIFAAMVLVSAYGVAGLVLAPLATAALQPFLESVLELSVSAHPTPARDLTELTQRLQALREKSAEVPEAQEVCNLVGRLDALVAEASVGLPGEAEGHMRAAGA
jgi:predicted PurR-regulated permease PerM